MIILRTVNKGNVVREEEEERIVLGEEEESGETDDLERCSKGSI